MIFFGIDKMKKTHWPLVLGALLLLAVVLIVARQETSPIAAFAQWISARVEGFAAPIGDVPKCPNGFRFFNDKRGESFCCAGTVNPYTHVCEAKEPQALCAFQPGTVDPRTSKGELPLCSAMIAKTTATAQKKLCPGGLPNYASAGKCCLHDTDLDGVNCTSLDADPKNYCVTAGTPLKSGERSCDSLRMEESSFCPASLNKISYTLGDKEVKKYGDAAKGKTIPVCFGMEGSCIPNNVLEILQPEGVYTGKQLGAWNYSCGMWEKRNVDRDMTGPSDASYP